MRSSRIIPVLLVCTSLGCAAQGGTEDTAVAVGGLASSDQLAAEEGSGSITGITLTRSGNDFQLSWTAQGDVAKVRIYTGTDPDDLDDLTATMIGADQVTITGLPSQLRHYFRVRGGNGRGVVVGERGLPQSNVVNLRDIGGYTAPSAEDDGEARSIAWGTFFRTALVQPNADQAFLSSLGIRTVIDLRSPTEQASAGPQNIPGATIIHRPIFDQNAIGFDPVTPHLCFPGNQTDACYAAQEAFFGPNGEFLHGFKQAGLRALVSGNGPFGANFGQLARDAIQTLFVTLADAENLPFVWADSGGDARAGWGSAAVELLLGVPEDQVIADYALSTQFRQAVNQAQINSLVRSGLLKKAAYIEPQLDALPEYMAAAIDEMHTVYGSVEDYARALGITDEQIRRIRKNLLRK